MTPSIFNTRISPFGMNTSAMADAKLKVDRGMVPGVPGKSGVIKRPEYGDPLNQKRSKKMLTIFSGLFKGPQNGA